MLTERGPLERSAADIAATLAPAALARLSAGDGAKGPRLYDWTRVAIRPLREPDREHSLLVRRSQTDPEEVAYYVCFAPAGTALAELARVAGTRWTIESCIEDAEGEVGLDTYAVRKWAGWYRHLALAMFADAMLSVIRGRAEEKGVRQLGNDRTSGNVGRLKSTPHSPNKDSALCIVRQRALSLYPTPVG